MPRRKTAKLVESVWIPESRDFFDQVILDTIKNVRMHCASKKNLPGNKKAIKKLETLWLQKYKYSTDRKPESNPDKQVPKKKPQTRRRKATNANPNQSVEAVDIHALEDNVNIVYRIRIPPLKPHWQLRNIDLNIPAYVCKRNLIEPLINWELLDRVMTLPLDEGTAVFQECVTNSLQL